MSSDKNNLDGTVSKTYVDSQVDLGTSTVAESSVSAFHFGPSEITHRYHPHHDAIRIRVLEAMVSKLLHAIERLPDVSLDVVKIRHDFDEWRDELKYSKVVDRLYVTSYEINYNSLPYQLNVPGLSSRPSTSE